MPSATFMVLNNQRLSAALPQVCYTRNLSGAVLLSSGLSRLTRQRRSGYTSHLNPDQVFPRCPSSR